MFVLAIFLLVSLLFLTLAYLQYRNKFLHLRKKYFSPQGYPVIGHVIYFLNPQELLKIVRNLFNKLGTTFHINLLFDYYLVTEDPKFVEFICTNNALNTKGHDYFASSRWIGTGLLTATGEKWHQHRKILTPSFHYNILEEFVKVFNSASSQLVSNLKKAEEMKDLDIYKYVTLLTFDVIHGKPFKTAMGTKVNAQTNPDSKYFQSVLDLCNVLYRKVFSPIGRIELLYKLTGMYREEVTHLKTIHSHSNNIIKRRKEVIKINDGEQEITKNDIGMTKKFTFLDVLLRGRINGQPLPSEDIREEVDTFMFEGHDTTAVAMSFILYAISNHQEIQAKAYEEIYAIFGDDHDRPASHRELQEMKYLELVIKEGLRMYPSVPAMSRLVTEDTYYEGQLLPRGLELVIVTFCMHRNPNLFPNPEKFDPERFTVENSKNRHPFAYIPFSAGSRNCIGQKFAMLELKSAISKVLRNFQLLPTEPKHEVKLTTNITLHSSNGMKMRLRPRITNQC